MLILLKRKSLRFILFPIGRLFLPGSEIKKKPRIHGCFYSIRAYVGINNMKIYLQEGKTYRE